MSEETVKIVKITGNHKLSPSEIDTAKTDFIITDQKIINLEAEKQSFNASIKASVKEHEEKKERLRLRIMQGYEEQLIDCYEQKNYDEGNIQYVEVDTGEVIQTRKMSESDRQQKMFPGDEVAQDGESPSEDDTQEVNEMVDEVIAEQESQESEYDAADGQPEQEENIFD